MNIMNYEEFPILSEEILQDMESLQMPDEPDIVVEVFETFINSCPARLSKLREISKSGDLKSLSREAHAIKSSAKTIGALRLGEFCQQLEHHPEQGLEQSSDLIQKIGLEVEVVIKEMKRIRPQLNQKH